MRLLFICFAMLTFALPAQARQRAPALDPSCNVLWPCVVPYASSLQKVRETRGLYVARQIGIGGPRAVLTPKAQESALYEGRPAGCPHAWCGCWLASHLGMQDRSLWLARNWASVGHPSGPQVGAIAVWRHHVGKITAVDGNRILLLSGNDGRAVRERWRSMRGIIAFRTM